MLIAQISDTHILAEGRRVYGEIDSAGGLARAIEQLNALDPAPDLVLATGDLTDRGRPGDYAELRRILARLRHPLYLMPGNHDDRAALKAAFPEQPFPAEGEFLHYAIEGWPLRILMLDTQVPGSDGGELCPARLAWLEARLAEGIGKPTLIAMHHPPVAIGIGELDATSCANAEEFGAIVQRHPEIERIACGHVHRASQSLWRGTLVAMAPSTAHQVNLDLDASRPLKWVLEPPGLLLHDFRNGSLVSHVVPVGAFGPARLYA